MMRQNLASSKQSLWCAHGAQTRELASPVQIKEPFTVIVLSVLCDP